MDWCKHHPPLMLPPGLSRNPSPLQWETWKELLQEHSDRLYANYIVSGLREGFRIGFSYGTAKWKSSKNMESAWEHPDVVSRYLQKERDEGRVVGPFNPVDFPEVRISRFGIIPKKQPDSWCLILDLSSLGGFSINDGN